MNKGFYIVRVSSRIGKMFRTITGDYNAAAPAGKNTWVVARFAIAKANRHSVRHLRTFRQAGRKTVAGLLAVTAQIS
jgi:hypothetical protein